MSMWREFVKEKKKEISRCVFPSPFEYSMPHIKTIQAENIVIYSPRVQQCITITLHWAISIQATSIMPAKKNKREFIEYWKYVLVFIRWKHIALPHTCQRVGYIMMYNKWLNYFPIFSPMKSNIKAISEGELMHNNIRK